MGQVRKSNELIQRTINILRAAHNAGSEFGIESPADHGDPAQPELFVHVNHAPLWVVSEIIALRADTECSMNSFLQCAVGAPWRKDTTFMCTPALCFILSDLELLECTHESHEQRAVGVRESDGTWNSKRAAAYPAQLNIILAQAMARLAAPTHTHHQPSPSQLPPSTFPPMATPTPPPPMPHLPPPPLPLTEPQHQSTATVTLEPSEPPPQILSPTAIPPDQPIPTAQTPSPVTA